MLLSTPRHYLIMGWTLVLLIIFLSVLPGNSLPTVSWLAILSIDKIGHFLFYGTTSWSFSKYYKLKINIDYSWAIGIFLLLMGIGLEGMQYYLRQGRHFDLLDILANTIGIFCGLKYFDFIVNIIFNRRSK
jgi:VanZ family protein